MLNGEMRGRRNAGKWPAVAPLSSDVGLPGLLSFALSVRMCMEPSGRMLLKLPPLPPPASLRRAASLTCRQKVSSIKVASRQRPTGKTQGFVTQQRKAMI